MDQVIVYLTFSGNCREAMLFYQHCLGGELHFQTVGETSNMHQMPEEMKNYILESVLQKDNLVIKGTDLTDQTLIQGNAVYILLECDNVMDMEQYYKKLSVQGKEYHPLSNTYYGYITGMLTDKYGFHWLLRCRK